MEYPPNITALLLVDPYNDFLSAGGKMYDGVKAMLAEQDTIANLARLVDATRAAGIQVVFVPHHRAQPDDHHRWKHATPMQQQTHALQAFAKDSWGGTFHPDFQPQPGDIVAQEHFGASGFGNTDLDFQLKQLGLEKLIVVGMVANTCIETTAKFATELGYHVTLVKDATAAFTREEITSSHTINAPTFAGRICTTAAVLDLFANHPQGLPS
jgi:nicotinamidase-related amidase